MHPPAVIHSTAQNGGKEGLLPLAGGKSSKDRQNVENIVPSQNGTGATGVISETQLNNQNGYPQQQQASGRKSGHTKATATNTTSTNLVKGQQQQQHASGNSSSMVSSVSTLNSTSRRRSHRTHSPNRKRQEQQNIFNSLKAWNVKIAPSNAAQDKRETPTAVSEPASKGVTPVAGGGQIEPNKTTTSSVENNSSSNTSSSNSVSNSISGTSSNNSNYVKNKKQQLQQQQQLMAAVTSPVAPLAKEGNADTSEKNVELEGRPTGGQGGLKVDHTTAAKKDTRLISAPVCESVQKTDAVADDEKLLKVTEGLHSHHPAATVVAPIIPSSITSSSAVTSTSSSVPAPSVPVSPAPSANVSSAGGGGSKYNGRASNAGKVLLPNLNPLSGTPLDQFAVLQGKLRNSMKLDGFISPQQSHHISLHHHSAHQTANATHHHQGQGQQQQQPQQQQAIPPTTPPHYSLDFLHYVGMRMSTANGSVQPVATNASAAAAATAALFRGNPHFNYNTFNQQLQHQQPQIIHQQQQQQTPQPVQQQHLHRHYSGYYEDLMVASSGTGEAQVYNGYVVSEHGTNGVNDSGMAYCYSQNHQHHHHHNHPPHQQSYAGHQSYHHTNNNYQQHNRNYGGGRGGQTGPHNGGGHPQGKKSWNNSWHGSKKSNYIQGGGGGKYGNKVPGINHGGYRKNYHHYNNNNNNNHHHVNNGNHQYESQHPSHHNQQDHMRNLVYIRGFDRGHGAPSSQESTSRSPTPSPQSESPAIDTHEPIVPITATGGSGSIPDEKSDSGIEDVVRNLKKLSAVPSSSSSSSSVVSIPSTDSSAVSCSASQNLSIDLHCGTGQGYESDSSHSSSYNSHTYRHRKYTNSGQVYRSSSSTSSGVSSTTTFPPLVPDYPVQSSVSATNTPSATSTQVADFFLRSQSYHGSHHNLTVSGSASPNPPDSPVGAPRSLIGTQSMPMFSELFTGQRNHFQQPQTQPQPRNQNSSYGSTSSLESTIQPMITASATNSSNNSNTSIVSNSSSSGYGSNPVSSTVPPNETFSMQSGHPKKRYSGRSSPAPQTDSHKPSRSSNANTVGSSSQNNSSSHNRKNQSQSSWSQQRAVTVPVSAALTTTITLSAATAAPSSQPPSPPLPTINGGGYLPLLHPIDGSNFHTPADRFLARAHLVELLSPPGELAPPGSKWTALSTAVWDKFASTQQTQVKFVQKIQLWRYLFMCIRKAFPRLSLYLVGSTISGFASDSSDVDMCLVCRTNTIAYDMRGEALFQLGQLKNYFMNIDTYFEEFSVIQAKVPILRFRDSTNSVVVDLNYNNCVGIRNTHLLYCYSQLDWRLRPLTLVVKLWAQHHNINDAKNMTISSYSLVLMVIHFLQYGVSPPILPCLHAMYPDKFVRMSDISSLDLMETMEPYKNENSQTLGELFVQFLEYYANFDYTLYAISVRTASVISIESARVARSYKNDPHHWRQLCIEEPFDLTNTARSVFDAEIFEQIKSVFSTCWRRLKDTNDLSSVFECQPLFIPVASTLSITS